MEEEEELQEADVLWPWPDTPPPSPEDGGEELHLPATELYEYGDAAVVVAFSCEPFSEPALASSSSSLTMSAPWSDSSSGGSFFLSGASTVSAGLELDAAESFLEADVLWPDTADDSVEDAAAEFWWRCRRRLEEEEAAAAAVCGTREGRKSSPIDIPMATTRVFAARRRPSPSAMPVHRRR
ncbi:hypothetical protein ACP70R_039617 [Stipagrostis hirtigluma subsp. patula]